MAVFIGTALVDAGRAWTVLRIDAERLEIRQPLLRRTVLAVEHADILAVAATTFNPTGWSRRAYGVIRRAKTIGYRDRSGVSPALHLSLTGGYELLVTLPAHLTADAQQAVRSAAGSSPPA